MNRLTPLILAFVVAACAAPAGTAGARLQVVATTTVLADLVRNVAGDGVDVRSIVPAGGEPHTFDPTPSDVARIGSADLVIANGLGLDDWVAELVADAGATAPVVHLGEDLEGVAYRHAEEDHGDGGDEGEEDEHGHEEGTDPHLWLNVAYAGRYVERIRDALSSVDPDHADAYAANATTYLAELATLDDEVRDLFADVPTANRRVVSYHEAFGYFADAYGLEVVATVTDAPGQDPSAGDVAALIDEVRATGVRAILAEAQFPTELAERIAEETGIVVVTDLYSDSLGPPPDDSYVGMVRSTASRIAEVLR
jgi:ABC-type Zn uptake system ZnuABC Zn-binding protein ZnuA